jgi:hypothetical protein
MGFVVWSMDFTYGTTNCNMEVEARVIDPRLRSAG